MVQPVTQGFIKKNLPLLSRKGRIERGLFIVEGEKFTSEIPGEWPIECFIISKTFSLKHNLAVFQKKAPVYIAQDYQYKRLSDTVTPQGIMAICKKRPITLESILNGSCLLLMCDSLSDPGNVGALVRTANAAGASGVILTHGSADLYCPKVIRASAGSIFQIPCFEETETPAAIRQLKSRGIILAAAHLKGGCSPYKTDMTQACCIIIGNEARGLSPAISAQADILIKIPMKGNTESLNAAAAGSILLYEAVRQRIVASIYL